MHCAIVARMSDPYITGKTRWLHDADDSDAFWAELKADPTDRGIRLHLRDGSTDSGPFVGADDVTGLTYAPEPDGYASIAASGSDYPRNHLRADIIGFTPLD
jgi:hypothetical protein